MAPHFQLDYTGYVIVLNLPHAYLMVRYVGFACALSILFVHLSHADTSDYFTDCSSRTGSNATVIITDSAEPTLAGQPLSPGVEIATYSLDGLCAGVGTWDGSSLAVTVWGDDSQTEEKDGLAEGERFVYRLWDPNAEVELSASNAEMDVTYDASELSLSTSEASFADGAVYQVSSFDVTIVLGDESSPSVAVDRLTLYPNYPDPAADLTTFEFDLPLRAVVRAETFDLLGRRISLVAPPQPLPAGRHTIQVKLDQWPSGTYVMRLRAGETVRTRTFKVVRN